ncbi:MAG: hypothetical protein QM537_02490 [Candidatus Symbiobacter sp.]|nr:hypothetical protein [Candidatus Symbiobacter sp.]
MVDLTQDYDGYDGSQDYRNYHNYRNHRNYRNNIEPNFKRNPSFFGSFVKGLGSLFSLAPVPDFAEKPMMSPQEISAAAWKMTGDSLYQAMGKTPPPPPTAEPLSDEEIKAMVREGLKGREAEFIKELEENKELTMVLTITTKNKGEENDEIREIVLEVRREFCREVGRDDA